MSDQSQISPVSSEGGKKEAIAENKGKIEGIENAEKKGDSIEREKSSDLASFTSQEILKAPEQNGEGNLEIIKEQINQQPGGSGVSAVPTDDKTDEKNAVKNRAEEIYNLQDADQQVEKLIQLATMEDPTSAIKVAQHLDENYVMDKLHDGLLSDKIQVILREKGILK